MTSLNTLYNVHAYREMRLYFSGITAQSPEDAARIASEKSTGEAEIIEDCEGETLCALVDIDGDSEYSQSRLIDFRASRRSELLDALNSLATALNHHAHWRPTMPSHLGGVVRRAIEIANTL